MSELYPIRRKGDDPPRADVIFVHGLGGGPFTTWQYDTKQPEDCWPYWLADDRPNLAVHTLDYGASPSNWLGASMPLYDRAREVLTRLQTLGFGARPIVFVAHSLGGLVVKSLLEQAHSRSVAEPNWAKILAATKAVVFVGTPHVGAGIAKWTDRFGWLFRASPALRGLRAHREDLRSLQEWYVLYSRDLGIRTEAFYETAPTNILSIVAPCVTKVKIIRHLPIAVKVVEEAHANPGVHGVIVRSQDGDHLSICKPAGRSDAIYVFVLDVIDRSVRVDVKGARGGSLPLPGDLRHFEGRKAELAALIEALEGGGQAAVAAIDGLGGVGKSTLAIRAAHRLAATAPDGQLYLDLAGASERPLSALDAIAAVVRAFEPKAPAPATAQEGVPAYRALLDGKRILLVLDNARDAGVVAPFVQHLPPSCRLIVTSRDAMPFPGITRIPLEGLQLDEAIRLLRDLLGPERASRDELAALAERCALLPLALHAAAGVLTSHFALPIGSYLSALAKERERLGWLKVKGLANLDVATVLGFSVRQLDEDGHALAMRWAALAVFPATFDAAAAAVVWQTQTAIAEPALHSLVARSMVHFEPATGRFSLHDLMRELARSGLVTDVDLDKAAARLAPYFVGMIIKAFMIPETFIEAALLRQRELPNLEAGLAWVVENAVTSEDAAGLAAAYAESNASLLPTPRFSPVSHEKLLLGQLDACRKTGDHRAEGNLLAILVRYLRWSRRPEAVERGEARLKVAREIGDRRMECSALHDLGETCTWLWKGARDFRRAVEYYEPCLGLAREIGDRSEEGIVLQALGNAHYELGDPRRALEHYEPALVIARELGDRRRERAAHAGLVKACSDVGEPRRALEHYDRYRAIPPEIADREDEAAVLRGVARAWSTLGEPRQAIRYHEQRLAIGREIRDETTDSVIELDALGDLGLAWEALGEPRRAIEQYEQMLKIAQETGNRHGEVDALVNLGDAHRRLGEAQRAAQYCEEAVGVARDIGSLSGEGKALHNWALVQEQLGERLEAIEKAEAALAVNEEIEALEKVEAALGIVEEKEPWTTHARALAERLRGS